MKLLTNRDSLFGRDQPGKTIVKMKGITKLSNKKNKFFNTGNFEIYFIPLNVCYKKTIHHTEA